MVSSVAVLPSESADVLDTMSPLRARVVVETNSVVVPSLRVVVVVRPLRSVVVVTGVPVLERVIWVL